MTYCIFKVSLYVLPYGQMSLWGILKCLKCDFNNNILYINHDFCFSILVPTRIRAEKRIGPHNLTILSIIVGSLLGDGHAEYRTKGKGTRISFYQEASHLNYIHWLHQRVSENGYCNSKIPQTYTRLGKSGKVRKVLRFNTWTYSSLNWIHESWYDNGIKIIPNNLELFLTPLALSIWIMDDGAISSKGLKLCTNSFSYSECQTLTHLLWKLYNLKATVQKAGAPDQYIIYIWKESMPILNGIVSPYIIPSMKYKINV